jgi:biotin operon repressor
VEQVQFDRYKRMKYHPAYHKNMGQPWSFEDLQYLINYYDKIGGTEMSFALERTETSVLQRVNALRKAGIMSKPSTIRYFKR